MEIRFEEKNFQIPDFCPIDGPKNRTLRRHLQEHGIESLLTSTKLSQFSSCILEDLLEKGADIIESTIEVSKQIVPEPGLRQVTPASTDVSGAKHKSNQSA